MPMTEDKFNDEKLAHIARDYEAAWSCIGRPETRILSIRQWSIGKRPANYTLRRRKNVTVRSSAPRDADKVATRHF